jgi:hypothetical protein
MVKKLNNNNLQMKPKSGLKANINTTATKSLAVVGEFHYCTDTGEMYVFNGTESVQVAILPASTDVGYTGSFTNGDGATVTVKNGIITTVV